MFGFVKDFCKLITEWGHFMALLEDINSALDAQDLKLSEIKLELDTVVTEIEALVAAGQGASDAVLGGILTRLQNTSTAVDAIKSTVDQAVEEGAPPVTPEVVPEV